VIIVKEGQGTAFRVVTAYLEVVVAFAGLDPFSGAGLCGFDEKPVLTA
jgi:hypothetical protein